MAGGGTAWFQAIAVAWGVLIAAACSVDTVDPGPEITITEVIPAEGPSGTIVEIHGENFVPGSVVLWGGEQIQPAEMTDTVITVEAPVWLAGGSVDIEVFAGESSGVRTDGFSYRGGNGAALAVELFQYANPGQFNPPGVDTLDTFAAFVVPVGGELITAELVSKDGCELNPNRSQVTATFLDVGPSVDLLFNSAVLSIPKAGDMYQTPDENTELAGFIAGAEYTLQADGGVTGQSLPALDIQAAVRTPQDFNLTEPAFGAFPFNTVPKADPLAFSWTGAGDPNDIFEILLRGYKLAGDPDDGLTGEDLVCWAIDDGSFVVPATDLVQLSKATHAIIIVSRRSTTEWSLDVNQFSSAQTVGIITEIGGLILE